MAVALLRNIIQLHWSILYLAFNMDLHYLIFMGRNLENIKKLTPARIMNSKNIVNKADVFNESVAMNSVFSEQYHDKRCIL